MHFKILISRQKPNAEIAKMSTHSNLKIEYLQNSMNEKKN